MANLQGARIGNFREFADRRHGLTVPEIVRVGDRLFVMAEKQNPRFDKGMFQV